MTNRCLIIVLVGLITVPACAQVKNNSIGNRVRLTLDQGAVNSTTAGSSVEWDCVNKALTRKCLVYHNDQWFEFTVSKPGRYFINISAQQCADDRGVQAIVIEGNPCEINSYRILRCINRIRLEDAYVQLDSLKPGTPYLVNIDGFLGDACDFKIELASRARGFPYQDSRSDTMRTPIVHRQHSLNIRWVADHRINAWQSFRIYRWFGQAVPVLLGDQSIVRNALGAPELKYEITDSLTREGAYTYKVYAVEREDFTLVPLVTQQVTFLTPPPPKKAADPERSVRIILPFKDRIPIDIVVYDQKSEIKKRTTRVVFDPSRSTTLEIPLGDLVDQGVIRFLVLVVNTESSEAMELYYKYANGRFVRE